MGTQHFVVQTLDSLGSKILSLKPKKGIVVPEAKKQLLF